MKRWMVALFVGYIMYLTGCSSVDVTTDYDRDVNFTQYKLYDWMEHHNSRQGGQMGLADPLAQKHITSAIEKELSAKGIKQDESSPDFYIAYHTGMRNKVDVERYGYRYGRWGQRWGSYTRVDRYKEGSIVVDFIDAKTKDLIWRGVAKDAIGKGDSRADYINKCMEQLLKEFPPK